ncbi:MAG: DinB family protein [Nitrososphaerales archaeon]
MTYQFIVDTYETERVKVLSVWSMFGDEELPTRPHSEEARGRSIHEQMVHQCVSEDFWFKEILGVEVGAPPLPETETRIDFIRRYAQDSSRRLDELRHKDEAWWEEEVQFFDVKRTRAWIMMRRIAHTAHHRGQQTAMLRMLKHDLHSTYGPTADTGGLMQHHAPTIYAYPDEESLIDGEAAGGRKTPLPGPGDKPPTERRG